MPKVKKKYGGNPLLAKGAKMASQSKMGQELLGKAGDFVKNNWNLDSSFYKKGLEIINNNGEFDFDIFTI